MSKTLFEILDESATELIKKAQEFEKKHKTEEAIDYMVASQLIMREAMIVKMSEARK